MTLVSASFDHYPSTGLSDVAVFRAQSFPVHELIERWICLSSGYVPERKQHHRLVPGLYCQAKASKTGHRYRLKDSVRYSSGSPLPLSEILVELSARTP